MDIPGYKIVRTLGKGGMATVFLAVQESFERDVALKVMNASLAEDTKFTARFLSEAKIVSQLIHPNIVTVYDVGVHENYHFLSMQFVPGTDLKHQRQSLSLSRRINAIKDVAKALDYAGRKGYVHRDVKPENIMLHEEDGHAVLMDFGIATMSDTTSGMTQTGTAIGTPHYMSPEQAKGKPVDPRSDIYSLGVVLFLMLTGHVPFDADSAVAVGIKHVSDNIPRLPKNLMLMQPIIDKVLAKDPDQRYQTGQELVDALSQVTEEDLAAIEKLSTRAVKVSVDTQDTESPTVVSGSISTRGITAVGSGSNKALKSNPDNTTLAATAVNTQATKFDEPGTSDKKATLSTNHQVANRVPQRTPTRPIPAATGFTIETPKIKEKSRTRSNTSTGQQGSAAAYSATTTNSDEEFLGVDAEDRRDYSEESRSSAKWWVVALLVLSVLVGGAVQFQHQLPAPVNGWVAAGVDKSLWLRDELYFAMGLTPPTESTNRPTIIAPKTSPAVAQSTTTPEDTMAQNLSRTEEIIEPDLASEQTPIIDSDQNTTSAATSNQIDAGEAIDAEPDARSLREELDDNLDVAPQLAQLYREVLAATPGDTKAEWGLKELREFHYRRVRESLSEHDVNEAQRYIDSLKNTFDDTADDSKLKSLEEQLAAVTQAEQRVVEGRALLEADQLTSPKNENALAKFDEALALDPNNPNALAGKTSIVDRYAEFTESAMAEEKWLAALDYAEKGLAIDATHSRLNRLQQQAADARKEQRELEAILAKADEQLAGGSLITPKQDSAYALYRRALSRDQSNARARQGLITVEQQLSQRIERAINRTDFDAARNTLLAARDLYKNSERLFALEASLETAIQEDFIARQPKISKLLVSGQSLSGLSGVQPEVIAVDRTLYIGIEFANFVNPTTVLQAVLYDGSRSVQIAQVPVIVSGASGTKYFTIDRAVEGFSVGGYTIDLMLDQELMSTLMFKVENQVTRE